MKRNGLQARFLFSSEGDGALTQKRIKGKKIDRNLPERFFSIDGLEIAEKVREIATSLCESEGVEVVHVEYQREQTGKVLRVYLDKPGGITLDDCTSISRQLSDLLDVNFETRGAYSLEVSSPGPKRPLCKKEDFESFKGDKALIRTARSMGGRKNFKGILRGVIEDRIILQAEDKDIAIPLEEIAKAHLLREDGENTC
ncbi:MAG: ribosome maturation factor [Desulfobacterales bacterium CG07_land_8_20_14_0_80_52_14]|nr:MAG: ribosome maturation factor [Desulfobacterales bacterium CG23_combo_of_CG06-09_8_20_14_all_52_9]PIU50191.1 MAG: ribosome maturation factor [Desulfobacterales bacterium CG07_land_8_20_14_0_80_52_14]